MARGACALALVLTAPPLLASPAQALPALPALPVMERTVLVLEASSSLRATDPREMRKAAAELYVDLARDGDAIAIVGFDSASSSVSQGFITIRAPADRAALKQAIRTLGTEGLWSDLSAGLAEARRLFQQAPAVPGASPRESILLFTDGGCDPDPRGPVGEAARLARAHRVDAFCHARIITDLAPTLRSTPLYAFGLSRSAPRAFIEDLARRSGGVGVVTADPADLPRLVAAVWARLRGTTLLKGVSPGQVGLEVHPGARSLDVALMGPTRAGARLLDPSGAPVPGAPGAEATPEQRPSTDAAYRLITLQRPAPGTYTLRGGAGAHYLALEDLDLWLSFVDAPETTEIGKEVDIRVRLTTPSGEMPPLAFLDRHELRFRGAQAKQACVDQLATVKPVLLRRGADGLYRARQAPSALGELCFQAAFHPGKEGVLTRLSQPLVVRAVTPLKLAAAPVQFAPAAPGVGAQGTLSLDGSELGQPFDLALTVEGQAGLTLEPSTLHLDPSGPRTFQITLTAASEVATGPLTFTVRLRPVKPAGHEDRAIGIDAQATLLPVTFWERYHLWVKVGAGVIAAALFFLAVLLRLRRSRSASRPPPPRP
ncbi:vWA domain-containing protein [Chondromyces apiculatus]|uniref:VWFA domain-containing protein n=1 Tax=Chondromyces apiculatus DSM 436 TaxID=1192034 RepID=A0A017TC45_9BACT|nr:vWA domain-containing protein [Chondromyces apiculatus]EYF06176.1 Hypothetical protein CAP_2366 [Chondromyces apiculatus DSM 436]